MRIHRARRLSERLHAHRIEHLLPARLLGRNAFLDLLAESRVALCLPFAEEGFYLPALEAMSSRKEVRLFDAPEYSSDWTPEQIDEHYRPYFEHCSGARVRGETTPIYLFFPEIARELERYNLELKLIVLLRDPVERAISHYYMERNRDAERLPLWLALLCEPIHVRRCR